MIRSDFLRVPIKSFFYWKKIMWFFIIIFNSQIIMFYEWKKKSFIYSFEFQWRDAVCVYLYTIVSCIVKLTIIFDFKRLVHKVLKSIIENFVVYHLRQTVFLARCYNNCFNRMCTNNLMSLNSAPLNSTNIPDTKKVKKLREGSGFL